MGDIMARYTELLVRGDERELKAFLTGYAAASSTRIAFADEAGFHIRQLKERIKHHGEVEHVIVEEARSAAVRDALNAAAPRYRFEIKQERTLEKVYFAFEFDTPSEAVASRLKALLKQPPAGVVLEGYAPREQTDPGATGAEIYTPEHHYGFAGRGVIRGDVFAVIDFRAAMSIDFVECADMLVDGR